MNYLSFSYSDINYLLSHYTCFSMQQIVKNNLDKVKVDII